MTAAVTAAVQRKNVTAAAAVEIILMEIMETAAVAAQEITTTATHSLEDLGGYSY